MPRGLFKRTKEHRENISKAKKGKKRPDMIGNSFRFQDGHKKGMTGKKHTDNTKKKMSEIRMGLKMSEETKNKMSKSRSGKNNPMYGNSGKLSPAWKDGKSFEEYSQEWTDDLKDSIRKRDEYICQECGIHQDELDGFYKKLDIHHIDYNKQNLDPDNFITLCRSCHAKTNYNREYWIEYFNNK